MMKKLYLLLLVLTSCAPVYVPNIRNTPMFKDAGEFQGAFQIGNGVDVQAAVSVTQHVGLMGNFSYADRASIDNPDHYHYHKFYEGGVGYYTNMNQTFFEVFTGYGKGEGSAFDEFTFFGTDVTRGTGKFNRFFIQPAFGFNQHAMNVSFSSRISVVDMYEFTDETNSVSYTDSNPAVFLEPAVVGRLNFAEDHLFFTFQAGGSALLAGSEKPWSYRPFQWSMGLGFRIGGKKEKAVKTGNVEFEK